MADSKQWQRLTAERKFWIFLETRRPDAPVGEILRKYGLTKERALAELTVEYTLLKKTNAGARRAMWPSPDGLGSARGEPDGRGRGAGGWGESKEGRPSAGAQRPNAPALAARGGATPPAGWESSAVECAPARGARAHRGGGGPPGFHRWLVPQARVLGAGARRPLCAPRREPSV